MSRLGKVLLSLSGLAFLICVVTRYFLQEWRPDLWIPFGIAVVFLAAAVSKDFKFYKEIFMMKTTKHGMNFGATVLLVIILLIAVNYIGHVRSKKWDLTEEKLNTLSDQSVTVVKNLEKELEIRGFFRAGAPNDEQEKQIFEDLTRLYIAENKNVKTMVFDPFKRKDLTQKYNVQGSGEVVMTYNGKDWTLNDVTEEAFTNAMIRLSREKNKVIYYLTGHKEKDLESAEATGASRFKKALEDSSYVVKSLNLITEKKIPEDADVLLVLGSTQPLFEPEIAAVRDYLSKGGKLFLATDPGTKNNLAQIAKLVGVDVKSEYVVDQMGTLVGASAALAVGTEFSQTSEITNKFQRQMAGFLLAAGLSKSEAAKTIAHDDLVKSSPASFAKKEISGEVQNLPTDPKGPFVVGMSAVGKLNDQAAKEFTAVVFGDSDFLSNQTIDSVGVNRDLALNSVAYLAKDQDLISIRPKMPKGTVMTMTEVQARILLITFVLLPLVFFVMGIFIWLRRRGA
ncbi:MAG: GldG family protein [Bdellovibrionales bacterium]